MQNNIKNKTRKSLSADGLFQIVKTEFGKVEDHRKTKVNVGLDDALMSGFAVFSLKEASLLAFEEKRNDKNIKNIYKINNVPSDTHMRTILDDIDPKDIYPVYNKLFTELQRGKGLEDMVFYEGHYLLSNDGTGYFTSDKVHCDNCMEKISSKTGETKYYHQFLGSCIVHPDSKEVIPIAPEAIMKQDGNTKNDCEKNASRRFLKRFRKDHPKLKVIMVEDALSSNAPHIKDLEKHDMKYILGAKKGDHKYLFDHVASQEKLDESREEKAVTNYKFTDENGTIHKFKFINKIPLNKSNQDLLVNFLEYLEIRPNGKVLHFSWVTDIEITKDNAFTLMKGGRARWKIENETFNTLKNQGYNFEHNFGHGNNNLSTNFALLMMLAFMVDQIQQKMCSLFRATLEKCKSKRSLWEKMRAYFFNMIFSSMQEILEAILYGINRPNARDFILYDSG